MEAPFTVLYDGVCGLCQGVVQFILPRDRRDRFRFLALQTPEAEQTLASFGKSAQALDTFYLLRQTPRGPELLERGQAAIAVLSALPFPWSCARLLRLVPRALLNWGYDVVARRRYAWFGKTEACMIPRPEWRHKFIA